MYDKRLMNVETSKNLSKKRGRRRLWSDQERAKCYDLYIVQDLTGDEVNRLTGIPRSTVVDLALGYQREIQRAAAEAAGDSSQLSLFDGDGSTSHQEGLGHGTT